jgi:hypothetical protein
VLNGLERQNEMKFVCCFIEIWNLVLNSSCAGVACRLIGKLTTLGTEVGSNSSRTAYNYPLYMPKGVRFYHIDYREV